MFQNKHRTSGLLIIKALALLGLSVCLVLNQGCSRARSQAELEAYVKKIKARDIKEIEPLPEVKPYETFTYSDSDLRSPFVPSLPEEGAAQAGLDNGLRPDANRRKEPLEAFPLDSLRMVGTVERDGQRWAIIKDTDGTVHRIATGSYIGQNDGKIESISEEKMMINELVLDAAGTWHERKAFIALTDETNPKSTTK